MSLADIRPADGVTGRVLDTSALVAMAVAKAPHARALAVTAVRFGAVLVVPVSALAGAVAIVGREHLAQLAAITELPAVVLDPLDARTAYEVGAYLGRHDADPEWVTLGHVAWCARQRGWPVVTSEPTELLHVFDVEVDTLP